MWRLSTTECTYLPTYLPTSRVWYLSRNRSNVIGAIQPIQGIDVEAHTSHYSKIISFATTAVGDSWEQLLLSSNRGRSTAAGFLKLHGGAWAWAVTGGD